MPTPETGQQQDDRQGGQETIVHVGDRATPASVRMLTLQHFSTAVESVYEIAS
jgi:hypothetical protein